MKTVGVASFAGLVLTLVMLYVLQLPSNTDNSYAYAVVVFALCQGLVHTVVQITKWFVVHMTKGAKPEGK